MTYSFSSLYYCLPLNLFVHFECIPNENIISGNEPYDENQPIYAPFELVNCVSNSSHTTYHCYLMEFSQNFCYHTCVQDLFLALRIKLDPEIECMQFDMDFDRGSVSVKLSYQGTISLSLNQVCCLVVL